MFHCRMAVDRLVHLIFQWCSPGLICERVLWSSGEECPQGCPVALPLPPSLFGSNNFESSPPPPLSPKLSRVHFFLTGSIWMVTAALIHIEYKTKWGAWVVCEKVVTSAAREPGRTDTEWLPGSQTKLRRPLPKSRIPAGILLLGKLGLYKRTMANGLLTEIENKQN